MMKRLIVTLTIICTQNVVMGFWFFGPPKAHCNITSEETVKAVQEVIGIGDDNFARTKLSLSTVEYCEKVKESEKKLFDRASCINKGLVQSVLKTTVEGAKNVRNKCSKKEWRNDFFDFTRCLQKHEEAAEVHQCSYKLNDGLEYSLRNLKKDKQLKFACCNFHFIDPCIHKYLDKKCGKKIGNFGVELFWNVVKESYLKICSEYSMHFCKEKFPKEMADVEKIFNSDLKLPPRYFPNSAYRILFNNGD